MKRSFYNFKKLVVKIGSSLFSYKNTVSRLCKEISQISKSKNVVLVSSGAIFYGMKLLGLKFRPKSLNLLQATAAVGQSELMNFYRRYFKAEGLNCAQILLTWDDFNQRSRYIN
ncbi:MAG: glutamate 5-kinase, partial [Candidatus Omnitrophica bacterium]|nr:glutamate 5-kinase [Candidatus Omnitrophota bacterium]